MVATDCQVCGEASFKYRCSHCTVRSCSLPCFKSHQSQCQIAQTQPDPPSEDRTSRSQISELSPALDKQAPQTLKGEEVDHLFQTHPTLKAKLNAIYRSTLYQAPESSESTSRRNHSTAVSPQEKAFSRGLQSLKQRLSDHQNDEDLAAFVAYVNSLGGP